MSGPHVEYHRDLTLHGGILEWEERYAYLKGAGKSFSLEEPNNVCVVHLHFDYNSSSEVGCEIYHLIHHVSA